MEKISRLIRTRTVIFLLILFAISFFLRFYNLSQDLFFGPEQGIDFWEMKKIVVDHNPTLVGAKTDIPGIFHGPLYYYVSSIPFFFSNGNPLVISAFLIFLNCFSIPLIFILGKEMINRRVGLIAAVVMTTSYLAIIYPRWLSSHPLAIPLSILFFIFLNRSIQKKKKDKWDLFAVAVLYGLVSQAEFLNYIFYGIILLISGIVFRKQFLLYKKNILFLSCVILFLFSFSHYTVFDFKNDHIISKSILTLVFGKKGYYISYIDSLLNTRDVLITTLARIIIPFHKILAVVGLIGGMYVLIKQYKKNKRVLLILLWVFVTPIVTIFLRHVAMEQFFVGMIGGVILLSAVLFNWLIEKKVFIGYVILLLCILNSIFTWKLYIPNNSEMFFQSTQPNLKYSDQLKTIDKIYQREKGKDFSFQSYTIPYWSQQGWEYLFWQYGKMKYGYLPVSVNGKTLYVIIQDDPSYASFQKDWLKNIVNKWGRYTSSFRYGILTTQILTIK